jgi:hypothetical protein
MAKISSALLGVIGIAFMAAPAAAQGNPWATPLPTIGGPNGQGSSQYLGQSVGGTGGPTGSSIGTPGGSGQGPAITKPGGLPTVVGGGGGRGLTGKK